MKFHRARNIILKTVTLWLTVCGVNVDRIQQIHALKAQRLTLQEIKEKLT